MAEAHVSVVLHRETLAYDFEDHCSFAYPTNCLYSVSRLLFLLGLFSGKLLQDHLGVDTERSTDESGNRMLC